MIDGLFRLAAPTTLAAATLVAALITAVPAMAETMAPGASVTVRTTGLDLASEAGARELQNRIARASTRVCGGEGDIRDLTAMRESQKCRTFAMNGARPQMELAIAQARTNRAYAANDVRVTAFAH